MKLIGERSAESWKLYLVAGALLTGGPVWHYLHVNHYPFDQPEAVILPLVSALIGAALAVLGHRIGGWLESLAFGALLYVFLDLQFDLHEWAHAIAILATCVAVATIFRQRRAVLTCITLGTLYLASLPRSAAVPLLAAPASAPGSPELPVLVHLILDEQWGIGGLRAEGDTATASFLSEFYRQRGFEVYEAAYSRFERTKESISDAVSLGRPPRFNEASIAPAHVWSLRAIPYFEGLRARGYALRVYQSTHLDFCHAAGLPVVSCETQPGNSIANMGSLGGKWTTRARLAGRYFLSVTSHAYVRLHPDGEMWRRSTAGGGLNAIEHVRDAIAGRPPGGTAFFVHALLPHRPIEMDAECDAVSDPAWREGNVAPTQRSDSSWRARLTHWGGQIRCAHQALAGVLDALDSTVGRKGSIVIVHGDHGSRMFQNERRSRALSKLNARELNAIFSTLLAVRRPGVPPALYTEPVPVQDFLWELARNDFKGAVRHAWRHFVRGRSVDSAPSDTLRSLAVSDMLWARPPRAPGAADSSPFRH